VNSLPIDRDALTVAMAIAPGVYARNRMFAFHRDPEVKRAKARAAVLRGLVRQLSGSHGAIEGLVIERGHSGGRALVRYRLANLRFERHAELSEVEASCLLYMAMRAGAAGLHPSAEDRAVLHGALRRLVPGVPGSPSAGSGLADLLEG
jgi:hypothetical protein